MRFFFNPLPNLLGIPGGSLLKIVPNLKENKTSLQFWSAIFLGPLFIGALFCKRTRSVCKFGPHFLALFIGLILKDWSAIFCGLEKDWSAIFYRTHTSAKKLNNWGSQFPSSGNIFHRNCSKSAGIALIVTHQILDLSRWELLCQEKQCWKEIYE